MSKLPERIARTHQTPETAAETLTALCRLAIADVACKAGWENSSVSLPEFSVRLDERTAALADLRRLGVLPE